MPSAPVQQIAFDSNGLTIDGSSVGCSLASEIMDDVFGKIYRRNELRVEGQIERIQRFYDDIGIACLEYIAENRIADLHVNISEKHVLKTINVFHKNLIIDGVAIKNTMAWSDFKMLNMQFMESVGGFFTWKGQGLSCSIAIQEGKKSSNPNRTVRVNYVIMSFTV